MRTARCCCAVAPGMRKRVSFVLIWLARPEILDGPKHYFSPRNGTNGHESLVPFLPVVQGRIGLRHALRVTLVQVIAAYEPSVTPVLEIDYEVISVYDTLVLTFV